MTGEPERVGRFKIERLLGRGAMGAVFRAHDPDIDRTVAIKLIRTDLLDGDDRTHYVARFRNEARMVGRCLHPNIVAIHDFAMHEGDPFLVLEFVDGTDLGRLVGRSRSLAPEAARQIVLQTLQALAYAHRFGIIHRDIKPGNIMLTPVMDVKVTDFGISRALAASSTVSSVLVGTPCYMSPEQCLGRAVDARSDLFSLGCVLYEALSGERAFAASNYVATTHRILHDEPRPLRELRPDLPDAMAQVVARALAKSADDRFQTAEEMAQALQNAGPSASADATVVFPPRMGSAAPVRPELRSGVAAAVGNLAPSSLATIERRLAHFVGPIAGIQLRRVLRESASPADLARRLADLVPLPAMRERLEAELTRILASEAMPASDCGEAAEIPPTHVDTLSRALTQVIGPIAPRLLQRAMLSATTPAELEAACLELIDSALGREQFRRLVAHPGGSDRHRPTHKLQR